MCNASLHEGNLPPSQRHGIVLPLLKMPTFDTSDKKNYQPVSNLTFMSKVIERMVAQQLTDYIPPRQPYCVSCRTSCGQWMPASCACPPLRYARHATHTPHAKQCLRRRKTYNTHVTQRTRHTQCTHRTIHKVLNNGSRNARIGATHARGAVKKSNARSLMQSVQRTQGTQRFIPSSSNAIL